MIKAAELRVGSIFEDDGEIFKVLEFQHVKRARKSAFVRVKLKNIKEGYIIDKTYEGDKRLFVVELERKKMQFLYKEDNNYIFMDTETYEQVSIPEDILNEVKNYLVDNLQADILYYHTQIVAIEVPMFIELQVIDTEASFRGDTVQSPTKRATLQTGLVIQVPSFIEVGDIVKVDTRENKYIERVRK